MTFEEVNMPEFLEKLLAKDITGQRAFTSLVRATHDPFLGFIQRRLSSVEECREVLQEVYLAVHKDLAGFEGKSKLTTWMYSLTHHKICDRFADRDRKHVELTKPREKFLSTETVELDRSDPISAWDAPPDRVLARNAVETLVGKAVEALPEKALQIYQLRDIEGRSGEEAAEILGITPENARVQLHRARRQIVDWVQDKMAKARGSR